MKRKLGVVLIGLAIVLSGGFFIFPSGDNVSAWSLSTSPKQIATSSQHHAALETVTFDVPSMTCASCPFIVTKTLKSVPGVTEASADFETKTARVVFDKDKTNISALLHSLKSRGYPSSVRDSS
ncbi:MAG: cation transporter [Thermodesulfobacteriota bacterium]